jgi:hypothetical protein
MLGPRIHIGAQLHHQFGGLDHSIATCIM